MAMLEKTVKKVVMGLILVSSLSLYAWHLDHARKLLFLSSSKAQVRNEITKFSDSIEIGESIDSVQKKVFAFTGVDWFDLIQKRDRVIVRSPREFPGLTWSWDLYILFSQGHVNAILFRPMDGNFKLCGAPNDRRSLPKKFSNPEKFSNPKKLNC